MPKIVHLSVTGLTRNTIEWTKRITRGKFARRICNDRLEREKKTQRCNFWRNAAHEKWIAHLSKDERISASKISLPVRRSGARDCSWQKQIDFLRSCFDRVEKHSHSDNRDVGNDARSSWHICWDGQSSSIRTWSTAFQTRIACRTGREKSWDRQGTFESRHEHDRAVSLLSFASDALWNWNLFLIDI